MCPVRLSYSTSSFLSLKPRNSELKLAQVPEQSELTHRGGAHLTFRYKIRIATTLIRHDTE